MRSLLALLCVPLAALGLGACAAAARATVVPPPPAAAGFPAQAKSGVSWIEAAWVEDHAAVLGADLPRQGVLPVAVRLGRRAEDGGLHRLAEDFDPHLYLEDGTPLDALGPDQVAGSNEALAERLAPLALRPGLVPAWEGSRPLFLFFRLPRGARVDGADVLVRRGDHYRALRLPASLVAFDLASDGTRATVRVGLAPLRWSALR